MNNTYESDEDYLFVWHNGCFRKIDPCEVMYLEASRNYCTIYMYDKSAYLLSITLLKNTLLSVCSLCISVNYSFDNLSIY